jgi:flagellar basal body-associated protein FliL
LGATALKISKDLIILGVLGLGIAGSVYLAFHATHDIQRPVAQDTLEKEKYLKKLTERSKITFYNIPKLQTNVESRNNRLVHAELTISLEPGTAYEEHDIKALEPVINDFIISTMGQMTSDELAELTGKMILGEKIKNAINELTKKDSVKRVLFTSFSVQIQ